MNFSEPVRVLLSFGSNLGQRCERINEALKILIESKVIFDSKMSSFYETEPVGFLEQPWFINSVVSAKTNYDPISLFEICKNIEKKIGRITREKWHERELDIDILIYGNEIIKSEKLEIPHPRMSERRFVLLPASEIAGDFINPISGLSINEMLNLCKDKSEIKSYNKSI